MIAHESQQALKRLIADAGRDVDGLSVEQGVGLMFYFYRHHRADDCPPESDGDMLLYQWGTDEYFEVDLTRQFIVGDAEDENIWQLSLTFKFTKDPELAAIGSGDKWCHKIRPRAVEYFEAFVKESPAYRAVVGLRPVKVELDYFNAG